MAFTEALRLVVDADTRGAVRGVEQLGRTADRELSRSEKSLDRWGNRLTGIGAGLIGVGSVALVGLGAAAMASEEANLATVKLENSLKNMPKLAGESSQQFIDLADSIQDVTAADADAIVEAEALLATFNLTADEIKSITPLVVDLSRKFGIDMSSAAVQVGKALDGNVGALKRNGISIDETLFATDRYAAVQQALADQVGGFAEAEGATFAGSLERLKNEMGDLAEGVGAGAVDAFTSLFGVVDGLTGRFNELSPATQSAIGKFATFGSVGLIAAGGVSVVIGQVLKMHQNFSVAADAARTLATRIGGVGNAARVAAGAAGLVGLAFAAGQLGDQIADAIHPIDLSDLNKLERDLLALGEGGRQGGELAALAGDDYDRLADSIRRVADPSNASRLRDVAASLPFGGGENRDLEQARQKIDDIDKALVQLASRDPEAAAASFDALIEALEQQGISADTAKGLLNDYDSELASIDTGEAVAGSEELGGAFADEAGAIEDATSALQAYVDKLAATFDPLFGMISAQNGLRDAQVEVSAAQTALNEALASGDATAIAEAQRAYDDALTGSSEALVGAQQAQAVLNDAIEKGDVSLADAQQALIQWAVNAGFTGAQALAMAGQLGTATGAAQILDAQNPTVDIAARDNATSVLNAVSLRIQQLDGSTAEVRVNARATSTGRIGGVPIFHEGGVVGGAPRGQELLALVQAGEGIISLSDMDAMGRGIPAAGVGGGGNGAVYAPTFNLTFNGPTNDQQVVEALKRYERNNGPGWRN